MKFTKLNSIVTNCTNFLDPVPDYVKSCVDTVIKISVHEPSGDILVFLTGYEEVETVTRLLKDYAYSLADSKNRGDFRFFKTYFKLQLIGYIF